MGVRHLESRNSPSPVGTRLLVAETARMRQVVRLAEKLGRGSWPVLLLGETGTGKELIARTIHRASARDPFVVVDCSAMSGALMESELFGHAKGAFTGAHSSRIGLIEQADGGTAFFDEIGELPLDLQAKLLRVLQEKEFRPVGSTQTYRSNFRIIAATNRDLSREVMEGRFRQDLYYRLNVVSLRISPLRERKDEIPLLVEHFLKLFSSEACVSTSLLESLQSYDWPGNVRELENAICHMLAVNSGVVLGLADLPEEIAERIAHSRPACDQSMEGLTKNLSGQNRHSSEGANQTPVGVESVRPLAEMEGRAIRHALEYTKGDRVQAAALLGIGRTTLYRKMKEYGISW